MRYFALTALAMAAILGGSWGGAARAQTDLNAGKSAAQMFQSNCAACHRSPAGLARGRDPRSVASFLLEHYTARPENAGAIAAYITSARGSAPPQRSSSQGEGSAAAAPAVGTAAVPTVRPRPLDKLATGTVERLKGFASAADPAVPANPAEAPRGVKQIEAYAATGTPPAQLRQTAINAAMRPARVNKPTVVPAGAPESGAPVSGEAAKEPGATASTGAPPPAEGGEGASVLQLRGPPASGAPPPRQSNGDPL